MATEAAILKGLSDRHFPAEQLDSINPVLFNRHFFGALFLTKIEQAFGFDFIAGLMRAPLAPLATFSVAEQSALLREMWATYEAANSSPSINQKSIPWDVVSTVLPHILSLSASG